MSFMFRFDAIELPDEMQQLRREVRTFLRDDPAFQGAQRATWGRYDKAFTKRLGARGWLGMTWPKQYGGHARTYLERFVVLEELLAAAAPVSAHWVTDRQVGPMLLRFGTEEQRASFLPRMARGDCLFCIGMSEPDSGSDLASVRTRAVRVPGGWVVNGTKLWTSNAHRADYMILFCRSGSAVDTGDKHAGASQFIVDLKTPGIEIRPVINLLGSHDFNEVVFRDVFVPAPCLVGEDGQGWRQVMGELGFERSGPDRFLSSYILMRELVRLFEGSDRPDVRRAVGRLTAHLWTLRRMSLSLTALLQAGASLDVEAALVKDLGAVFEQEIPEIARTLADVEPTADDADHFAGLLGISLLTATSYSIRGGAREVLRNIIARGLGLR